MAAVALSGNPAARRGLRETLGRAEHFHRAVFRPLTRLGAARGRHIRDAVLALSIRQFRIGIRLVGGAVAVWRRDRTNRRMALGRRLKPAVMCFAGRIHLDVSRVWPYTALP